MCRRDATKFAAAIGLAAATVWSAYGQPIALDWRHIGNSAIELALPSVATGAVDRVWYSQDGSTLYARSAFWRIFQTGDLEGWNAVSDRKILSPAQENPAAVRLPETGLRVSGQALGSNRYY